MKMALRAIVASLLTSLLILSAGCGGGDKKSKISGVVTYKNAPVTGGNIYLTSDSGGSLSSPIQMDGNYSITDIPPGNYSVIIETESVNPDRKEAGGVGGRRAPANPKNAPAGKAEALQNEYAAKMGKSAPSGDGGGGGANGGFGADSKEELLKRYTKIPTKYNEKSTSGLSVEVGQGTVKKDFALSD